MQPALRSPPAFEVSTGGDRAWRLSTSLLAVLCAAALLAWLAEHLVGSQPDLAGTAWFRMCVVGVTALVLPVVGWLTWHCSASAHQTLRWDGQRWCLLAPGLAADGIAVQPQLVLDLDGWVMLRLLPMAHDGERRLADAPLISRWRYLRLSRADMPSSAWPLLRATLYSSVVRKSGQAS